MPMTTRRARHIEGALGFLAGVIVLALIGYLAWQGLRDGTDLPELSVAPVPTAAGEVRFVVRNEGGGTATDVAIALVLADPEGRPVRERRLVIDYVPAHSEATGGFVLPSGAEGLTPGLAVEGYLDP
jgi:uncharacterized protein (TIGR02588 family)